MRTNNDKKGLLSIIVILLFISLPIHAQKMTVESMAPVSNDISASQFERKDLNGTSCGLVKVLLPYRGAKFEGNVIGDVEYKTGEYWVYMTIGSKELKIKHSQAKPFHVKFIDYGIKKIESKVTYILSIQMPEIEEGVPMAKEVSPILPDWLNSNQPNRWVGISPPTMDKKKARDAAIINAVLGYLRTNKEGVCKSKFNTYLSNEQYSKDSVKSEEKYNEETTVSYKGFGCEVLKEYYNARGEYFVQCGFVDNSLSTNELKLQQSIYYLDNKGVEDSKTLVDILLFLNNQKLSCSFEFESFNGKPNPCRISVNQDPLIAVTDFLYDKYQWNQAIEGSCLVFLPNEMNQSLGVVTFSLYCLLPFISKSLTILKNTTNLSETFTEDMKSNQHIFFSSHFVCEIDTVCLPIPINFSSLYADGMVVKIGNVNFKKSELETRLLNNDFIVNKRYLEECYPYPSNYMGGAIVRLIKTHSRMSCGLQNLLIKGGADNILQSEFIPKQSGFEKVTSSTSNYTLLNNIGVHWYFENSLTNEQADKVWKQTIKTMKFPSNWPSMWVAAECKTIENPVGK